MPFMKMWKLIEEIDQPSKGRTQSLPLIPCDKFTQCDRNVQLELDFSIESSSNKVRLNLDKCANQNYKNYPTNLHNFLQT